MQSSIFSLKEHVVPAQYLREYAGATLEDQEDELQLHVRQYIPKNRHSVPSGAITIIGTHANGFPKELYEPLWEELYQRLKTLGQDVRSIWIADVAHQGMSGVLNEHKLGNDPGWYDHPRDLLHMINHFRKDMPRPLVGIGHSMGGNNLVNLSLMHPRLLSTLVLIDPIIGGKGRPARPGFADDTSSNLRFSAARSSTFRRDLWTSRGEAAASFKQSKFYQTWDPRVLDLWTEHGLRELPTITYPKAETAATSTDVPVTLTTTKNQEVHSFLRSNYVSPFGTGGKIVIDRDRVPDLDPEALDLFPFYRPESPMTFDQLPHLRPSALYIFGGKSLMSPPEGREALLERTGAGVGGSGGTQEQRVKGTVLAQRGHLIPMESPVEVAEATSEWLDKEIDRWKKKEKEWQYEWSRLNRADKLTLTPEWERMIGGDPRRDKQGREKL